MGTGQVGTGRIRRTGAGAEEDNSWSLGGRRRPDRIPEGEGRTGLCLLGLHVPDVGADEVRLKWLLWGLDGRVVVVALLSP